MSATSKANFKQWNFRAWTFRPATLAGLADNGPYTIEQQRLFTPGTIEAAMWPVGTVVQKIHTPGSFAINVTR